MKIQTTVTPHQREVLLGQIANIRQFFQNLDVEQRIVFVLEFSKELFPEFKKLEGEIIARWVKET